MGITGIRLRNFKSFGELDVELGNFNVVVGANASGKSNFVQTFRFLSDISNHGLDNAVSMQGGIEYLMNRRIGSSVDFSLEAVSDKKSRFLRKKKDRWIGVKIYETNCGFSIHSGRMRSGFSVSSDSMKFKCEFVELVEAGKNRGLKEAAKFGSGEITVSNVDGKPKYHVTLPTGVPLQEDDITQRYLEEEKLPPKTLLMELHFVIPVPLYEGPCGEISVYDFDPKLPKRAVPITGKTELEEDGSNLAIVLKNVIQDKNKKRKFSNLIQDLLPFVDDLNVVKFADKSLLFKLRETYFRNEYLPASLASDGTINMTALILALYFETKALTIFEEPERNVHPYLVSRLVDMMKDASRNKQIVMTTHNPEIVRHTGLENLLLVSRDESGFSSICKPGEKEEIKAFLEHELGIEELFVQDLLGVGM